jgi:hypothetical protein
MREGAGGTGGGRKNKPIIRIKKKPKTKENFEI